jgi:hypothetical protein
VEVPLAYNRFQTVNSPGKDALDVLTRGSLILSVLAALLLPIATTSPAHAALRATGHPGICRARTAAVRPIRQPEARRNRSSANVVDAPVARARLCGARSETHVRPRPDKRGVVKTSAVRSVV